MISSQSLTTWAIAVFAHNEGNNIAHCMDSLLAATQNPNALRIYVLNNGSSDNTVAVVAAYALRHSQIQLVEIQLGDKANAWNYFVHDLSLQADIFGFVDGDVTFTPGALDELSKALEQKPASHQPAADARHQRTEMS